ncbi:V/A-type H+-transporting ATPase subunit C [Geosporobacter subterraneus DSM 17957]|uniref:V/A-type H+-transporting ATPase subunit C n=1 Tax=Geosporobacter subterraneus DSM 17957 TaxID=1121919 RepID=A0A1M6MTX3_9FIRM|nr:V-type ATPase subunit [Geosporobacter subterraneus]SHJ86862.1 V/A-type H+-transporting ATPase subunit C [Geosporobacter subterraneus DSM 17957]
MGNVRQFAAVNTKIKGMESRFLHKEDYLNLLRKRSVREIGAYLREKTDYAIVLENVQMEHIHRDELEQLLKKYIHRQVEKLIHFFIDDYRKFFKLMLMRYEIEDLKLYLRAITRGGTLHSLQYLIHYAGKYSSLPHNKLSQAKSMEELVSHLKDTPYYLSLLPVLQEDEDKRLFHMEMNLDILYFRLLQEQNKKLSKEDKKLQEEILGINVDLLNLQWIYRGIKFYQLVPEELINYMLPNGHAIGFQKIKQLCYAKDEREFLQRLGPTKYGFLFDNQQTQDIYMERRIARFFYFLFQSYRKKEKMNIGTAMIYIHLLEYQTRDIISIIEAIRYGLDEEKARQYLIRKL